VGHPETMAIPAITDTLDGVAEPLHEHYAERDGKFYLDVTAVGGYALEDVNGLKTALSAERTAKGVAESRLKEFGDADPKKAKSALAKYEELLAFDPEKESDKLAEQKFKAQKDQLLSKHAEELAGRDAQVVKVKGELQKTLIDAQATQAIVGAKGNVRLLLPHLKAEARLREADDGTFLTELLDEFGNSRIGDAKGNPLTFKQRVEEMKTQEDFQAAFAVTEQSGGGSSTPPQGGGGGAKTVSQAEKNRYLPQIASGEVVVAER